MRLARPLCAAFAIAMMLAAPPARAEEPTPAQLEAARATFKAAMTDEDEMRWSDALEKLRRVAVVKMTAGVRYHIALCEEHLGQLVEALGDYAMAEARARQENAADVIKLVPDRIKAVHARVPHLTVVVPSDVPDIEVKLDGEPLARAHWGSSIAVDPGEHRLEASGPGRTPLDTKLRLQEREAQLYEIKLAPRAPAPMPAPAPSPAPTPAPAPARAPAPATASAPAPAPASRGGAIVATAGAVVLAGGGVVSFLLAGSAHDDAQTQCATRTSPCDDLKQSVRTWDTLAASAFVGAAALGVVAVVLWTKSPDRATTVGVTPGGILLRGSF